MSHPSCLSSRSQLDVCSPGTSVLKPECGVPQRAGPPPDLRPPSAGHSVSQSKVAPAGGKPPRAGRGGTSLPARRPLPSAELSALQTLRRRPAKSGAHSHVRPAPRWGWRAGRGPYSGASRDAGPLCGWCPVRVQRGWVFPKHSEALNGPWILQPPTAAACRSLNQALITARPGGGGAGASLNREG